MTASMPSPIVALRASLSSARLLGFSARGSIADGGPQAKAAFVGVNQFNVTSTADDGSAGTLRSVLALEAQDAATNGNYNDQIVFDQGIAGQTITLQSPLTITQPVVITGFTGFNQGNVNDHISISGGNAFTDINVATGTTNAPVSINNLTIADGNGTGAAGTAGTGASPGTVNGGAGGDAAGGIFVQSGALSLNSVDFVNNTATGGTGGNGGIYFPPGGGNPTKGAGGQGGNAAGAVYVEPGATVSNASGLGSYNDTATAGKGGSVAFLNTAAPAGTADPVSNSGTVRNNTKALDAACYCTGTLIRTARGDVAVENLAVGDVAVVASGAHRPIKWIGQQELDCRNQPYPASTLPVRVREGAFGAKLPSSDLWLSPGHAVCLDILGEILVPVGVLVNGATIVQEDVDSVTYWHVELDSHDILIANGMPAESYIDVGNRAFFTDGEGSPDGVALTLDDYCRPFIQDAQTIAVMRTRLLARAAAMGWSREIVEDLDIHLVVDGNVVRPDIAGNVARFVLSSDVHDMWLASKTFVPQRLGMNDDARHLGLQVRSIGIDDGLSPRSETNADDPSFCVGFHGVETLGDGSTFRWTSGRSMLSSELWAGRRGTMFLQVALNPFDHQHWVFAEAKTQGTARPQLQLVRAA